MNLVFKYDPWNPLLDQLLFRAGSKVAFGLIQQGIPVSRPPTPKQGTVSNEAIDGVIGLLASAIEWLREYGLTAEDVQARVNRVLANNRDTLDRKVQLTAQQAQKISDPRNEAHLLNPKQVLP